MLLEQPVLAHGGDQDIGEAVVVVIGHRHAHAVHLHRQAGALGHVGEGAVAIVAVELEGAALALVAGPVHAVHQQDVEPAIAIVIEKRAAGPHGLGQILGAERAAVVMEVDARRGGDIGQPEAQARRRAGSAGRSAKPEPAKKRPPVHAMLTKPSRMA